MTYGSAGSISVVDGGLGIGLVVGVQPGLAVTNNQKYLPSL